MLNDTPDLARYLQLQRAMTHEQRLAAVGGMCAGVRRAVILALRAQHPTASDDELRKRLMVRLYGRAEAVRVFGSVPDDAL